MKGSGAVSEIDTSRGQVENKNFGSNFEGAVTLAIKESRRQWADFQADLAAAFGKQKAFLMICAMTRDDPVNDCCSDHMDTDPLNCGACGNKV